MLTVLPNVVLTYTLSLSFAEAFLPESPDTSDLGKCRAFKTTTVRVFVVD